MSIIRKLPLGYQQQLITLARLALRTTWLKIGTCHQLSHPLCRAGTYTAHSSTAVNSACARRARRQRTQ